MHLQLWMLLAVLLSAGSRLSAVDVNWLTHVVRALRAEYRVNGQFCIAANIPLTRNDNILNQILQRNSYQQISESLEEGEVHETNEIIIAKPEDPVHAERRVLEKISTLQVNSNENFLLIYSYLSPCSKCTDWDHEYSIFWLLYDNLVYWEDAAFVFTTVYDRPSFGPTISSDLVRESLYDLGTSMCGLHNVYRCYGPNQQLECHSCSSQNLISQVCLSNKAGSPQISQNEGGARSRNRGRDSSSNRRRDRSSSSNICNRRGRYDSQDSRSPSNQGRS